LMSDRLIGPRIAIDELLISAGNRSDHRLVSKKGSIGLLFLLTTMANWHSIIEIIFL